MNEQEWHASLFNDLNNYWVEIVDSRSTEEEAKFIQDIVKANELVLDLCCGTGRHSTFLSKNGWKVIGLDISPNLLRIAKKRMLEAGADFPLIRGEMRHLPFKDEAFEAVINMFTSFGYLPSESDDAKCLKEISRVLQKNGSFLLDIINREYLVQTFQKKDWGEFPSFFMLEKRTLDLKKSKLYSQWTIFDKKDGGTHAFNHILRLYTTHKLEKMLATAGLAIAKAYGGYDKKEFHQASSTRLIFLAKNKSNI